MNRQHSFASLLGALGRGVRGCGDYVCGTGILAFLAVSFLLHPKATRRFLSERYFLEHEL
ncbi:MAG: hypothetical protein HY420_00460 [Candidatus Kerfeldbacteria bacterium]|nr:hypothetical protein [Candidatus Kerfeldbacteria bacterium]